MANSLSKLFFDIANAIRSKTGNNNTIKAVDFPAEISNISTGINFDEMVFVESTIGAVGGTPLKAGEESAYPIYVGVPRKGMTIKNIKLAGIRFDVISSDAPSQETGSYWYIAKVLEDGTTEVRMCREKSGNIFTKAHASVVVDSDLPDFFKFNLYLTPSYDCTVAGSEDQVVTSSDFGLETYAHIRGFIVCSPN